MVDPPRFLPAGWRRLLRTDEGADPGAGLGRRLAAVPVGGNRAPGALPARPGLRPPRGRDRAREPAGVHGRSGWRSIGKPATGVSVTIGKAGIPPQSRNRRTLTYSSRFRRSIQVSVCNGSARQFARSERNPPKRLSMCKMTECSVCPCPVSRRTPYRTVVSPQARAC